jgi:hypothetical protein
MTQLTFEIAAAHDRWLEGPAARHAVPALKLWWRHFSKHHPIIAEAIEWIACGAVAAAIVAGSLVANT